MIDDPQRPSTVPQPPCGTNVEADSDSTESWLRGDCRDFYRNELVKTTGIPAIRVKDRVGLLRLGINRAMVVKQRFPKAQFLEFGVHEGKDLLRMATFLSSIEDKKKPQTERTIFHGFDSFQGLPEDWINGQIDAECQPFHKKGAFDKDGESPDLEMLKDTLKLGMHSGIPQSVDIRFHKGWFHESLPAFLIEHDSHPVAFVHADADLYTSTKTFLELLCEKRLFRKGSILVFDEFWNYPHWQDGEYKAWKEIVETHGLEYRYFGYHAPPKGAKKYKDYGYQSVGVVITRDVT